VKRIEERGNPRDIGGRGNEAEGVEALPQACNYPGHEIIERSRVGDYRARIATDLAVLAEAALEVAMGKEDIAYSLTNA